MFGQHLGRDVSMGCFGSHLSENDSANPKGIVDPSGYRGNRSAALKEYYKGALLHINATYRSEYFWIWTGEGWGNIQIICHCL